MPEENLNQNEETMHFVSKTNLQQYTAKVKEHVASHHDSSKLDVAPDGTTTLLDNNNKINISYIPDAVIGQLEFQGTWDASIDDPPQITRTPVKGDYYLCDNPGPYLPDGDEMDVDFEVGDWAVYDGTNWQKIDNTDAVTMVNGQKGAIDTYKGVYTVSVTYFKGDIVQYNNLLYLSLVSNNTGNTPDTSTSYWKVFGSAGGVEKNDIIEDVEELDWHNIEDASDFVRVLSTGIVYYKSKTYAGGLYSYTWRKLQIDSIFVDEKTVDSISVPDVSYEDVLDLVNIIEGGGIALIVSGSDPAHCYQLINYNEENEKLTGFIIRTDSAFVKYTVDNDEETVSTTVTKDPVVSSHQITAVTVGTDTIDITIS